MITSLTAHNDYYQSIEHLHPEQTEVCTAGTPPAGIASNGCLRTSCEEVEDYDCTTAYTYFTLRSISVHVYILDGVAIPPLLICYITATSG